MESADKNVNKAITNIINILKDIREKYNQNKERNGKIYKGQMEFIQMKICWMNSRVKNMLNEINSKLDTAEEKKSMNMKTEMETTQNEARVEIRLKK